MEIATFISGGVLALVSRALYDSVVTSRTQNPVSVPPPPPPPMQLLLPKPRVAHPQKPRVKMFVNVIPAGADLAQSYIGYNRSETDPSDNILIPVPAKADMMSLSDPPFTKDPNLVNVSRLRHIEPIRQKVVERNESEICKQLELGKTRLKKPSL